MWTASLAHGFAVLGLVQEVSGVASAVPGRNAVPINAVVFANGLTNTLDLLEAKFAGANIGREAVGVHGASPPADGLAHPGLGSPAVVAGALVGPGAGTPEAALVAVGLALARLLVSLEALAAVYYRDSVLTLSTFISMSDLAIRKVLNKLMQRGKFLMTVS